MGKVEAAKLIDEFSHEARRDAIDFATRSPHFSEAVHGHVVGWIVDKADVRGMAVASRLAGAVAVHQPSCDVLTLAGPGEDLVQTLYDCDRVADAMSLQVWLGTKDQRQGGDASDVLVMALAGKGFALRWQAA